MLATTVKLEYGISLIDVPVSIGKLVLCLYRKCKQINTQIKPWINKIHVLWLCKGYKVPDSISKLFCWVFFGFFYILHAYLVY